ncbi:hypothetical protein QTP88_022164 [Uroleucon formosanum]
MPLGAKSLDSFYLLIAIAHPKNYFYIRHLHRNAYMAIHCFLVPLTVYLEFLKYIYLLQFRLLIFFFFKMFSNVKLEDYNMSSTYLLSLLLFVTVLATTVISGLTIVLYIIYSGSTITTYIRKTL